MGQGTPATNTRVLFAQYNLSGFLSDSSVAAEQDLEDTTTYGDTGHEFTPTLKNGTINFSGIWRGDTGEPDPILSAAMGSLPGEPVSWFPAGFATIGNRAWLAKTRAQSFQPGGSVAGVVLFAYAAQCDGGLDSGIVLHPFAAETGTSDGTAVDHGAATANGGIANLHASAFTGTSMTSKIQHSVNGSVWVDLVTFTAVSAATSQHVEVAPGTTVNRHLREVRSGTFSSCIFCVAFARR
jgi:hypothetical protein